MQNIFLVIILIDFSVNSQIKAQNWNSRGGDRLYQDHFDDYDDDYQIARLEDEIHKRDIYISRLERRIRRLESQDYQQEEDDYQDYPRGISIRNYAGKTSGSKVSFPHDTNEKLTNKEMMDKIIPAVSVRMPEANCMKSCNHLKKVKAAKDPLSQYMYLMVCAEGCRKSIPCLSENYCMPVMAENPDFFVQCVSKCELFKIAPKIFKSGKC